MAKTATTKPLKPKGPRPTKKFLLMRQKKKVWFIVPWKGPVTVNWVFTGCKQQLRRQVAREIADGLLALGFERVV